MKDFLATPVFLRGYETDCTRYPEQGPACVGVPAASGLRVQSGDYRFSLGENIQFLFWRASLSIVSRDRAGMFPVRQSPKDPDEKH